MSGTIQLKVQDKDVKDFLKLIKTLDTSVNKLGSALDDVFDIDSKKMKEASSSLKDVKETQKELDKGASRRNQNKKRATDEQEKYNDALEDTVKQTRENTKKLSIYEKTIGKFTGGISGLTRKVEGFIPFGLGFHFSISKIVREAHQANIETINWSRELARLSDASGGTTNAISQMHEIFAVSSGSLATVRANMKGLVDQGIPASTKGFEGMVAWVTNLSDATGIGADAFNSFTGVMVRQWQVSMGANKRMMSSVLALQDAFGMTAGEIEMTMKTTGDAMGKMASFFKDGEKSAMALTKGISQTVGVLTKLGVSAQKANEFVGGLLDMDKFGENIVLFTRLGISYQETMDMMSSANAKELVFDKLMTNLPKVAQQIQSIANPMARMNYAKSLGLPLEIAQKMAKATTGEIKEMMDEYKKKAISDKAAQKKQEQMKADAAKFEDTLHIMKRDALLPMMQWLNANMKYFWQGAKFFFGVFKKYTKGLSNVFEGIKKSFLPAFDVLTTGGGFGDFLVALSNGILDIGQKILKKALDIVIETGPRIASGLFDAWTKLMKAHPVLTSLITVATGVKMFSGISKTFSNIKNAFKLTRGTPANPMVTVDVSKGGTGGIISKLTNFFTGKGGKLSKGAGVITKGITKGAGRFLGSTAGRVTTGVGATIISGILGAQSGKKNANKMFGVDKASESQEKAGALAGGVTSGGGAAIGAIIGSLIAPGIGTAIGGAIGGMVPGLIDKLSGGKFTSDIAKSFHSLFMDSSEKLEKFEKQDLVNKHKFNDSLSKAEQKRLNILNNYSEKIWALTTKQQKEKNILDKKNGTFSKSDWKNLKSQAKIGEEDSRWWDGLGENINDIVNGGLAGAFTPVGPIGGAMAVLGYKLLNLIPAPEFQKRLTANKKLSDSENSRYENLRQKYIAGKDLSQEELKQFKEFRQIKLYENKKGSTMEQQQIADGLEKRIKQLRKAGGKENKQLADKLQWQLNKLKKAHKMADKLDLGDKMKGWLAKLLSSIGVFKSAGTALASLDYAFGTVGNVASEFGTGIINTMNTVKIGILKLGSQILDFFRYKLPYGVLGALHRVIQKIPLGVGEKIAKKMGDNIFGSGKTVAQQEKLFSAYGGRTSSTSKKLKKEAEGLQTIRDLKYDNSAYNAGAEKYRKEEGLDSAIDFINTKWVEISSAIEASRAEPETIKRNLDTAKGFYQTQLKYYTDLKKQKEIEQKKKDMANEDLLRQNKISNRSLSGISNYTKQTAEALKKQEEKKLQGQDLINSLIGMQRSLKISQNMVAK